MLVARASLKLSVWQFRQALGSRNAISIQCYSVTVLASYI